MANEITLSASLSVRKGYLDSGARPRSRSFTLNAATPAKASGVKSFTHTTHTAIPIGDVATLGWARFENVDAANYIDIGIVVSGTFYPTARLKAGEFFPLRLVPAVTYYAKANTAAVLLDYEIYDD